MSKAMEAATAQRAVKSQGDERIAEFVHVAAEALAAKCRISELDSQIAADLDQRPDGASP